jgi:hypothetical protein
MRSSLLLLLLLLLFLSLGSSTTTVGCGSTSVNGFAAFGCSSESSRDQCDYIVTVRVTVLLDADSSPVQGAAVYIDTGPPDAVNTRVTGVSGQVFWSDTAFLTGFSAECDGDDVGTVEPYDSDTAFNWDLLVTAQGLAPAGTLFTVDRWTRDVEISVRMEP